MATKKPTEGPKAKLMKLSVVTLRKKAKALNISDISGRTKENLVQSIMISEARKKGAAKRKTATKQGSLFRATRVSRSGEQSGRSDIVRDGMRRAMRPGKRLSRTGKVYYERRANRSDMNPNVKPMLGGAKSTGGYVDELVSILWMDYFQYDPETEFNDAFHEVIDSMVIYYSDSIKIINDLQYFDWRDNDLGIEATNVSQVAYLALNELYGQVYDGVEAKIKRSR